MTPHWYDLLDVDPHASSDEIRAAWKSAIADLDPGDRRFRSYNEAAGVLLDPVRRAEYDATLAESSADPEPTTDPTTTGPADAPAPPEGRSQRGIPLAVVIVTVVVTVLLIAVTVVAWLGSDSERVDDSEVRAAQAAAETAVVPVISYDYRTLEADAAAARSYMTDDFGAKYEEAFPIVTENAPRTETVIEVEVLASGIVRTGEDRVDVLVFVNRPTTNKENKEPLVYRDQATLQMKLVDGKWLVDGLLTTPAAQ
ncbi:MAG: hypothetical protein Q8O61_11025 [Nocardioides sp.]|nr:hypothetical protein [Nocardioides sp.]